MNAACVLHESGLLELENGLDIGMAVSVPARAPEGH
jgi:hypothetical protein